MAGSRLVLYLRALRAFSLPLSMLPVLLATAVVRAPAAWDIPVLIASLLGAGLLHLGGNLLNDYFDFRAGVDREVSDDAGRPGRLLVAGLLRPREVLAEAVVCLAVAAGVTGWLVLQVGAELLAFALAGGVALYAYTGPPLALKYRRMGELLIFVTFGPLLVVGAGYAQIGRIDFNALLISLPAGLATTSVLLAGNLRDREEDTRAGIRTLGQVSGGRLARGMYLVAVAAAGVIPPALALLGLGPRWLLPAPLAWLAGRRAIRAVWSGCRLPDSDARTARFATALLAWMVVAYLLAGQIP